VNTIRIIFSISQTYS